MSMFNGTESDLPSGLSKPALRALYGAGYVQLDQFTKLTESELLKLHGLGPKTIVQLRSALAEKGLTFAGKS
jgi:hypothetical protein